MCQQFKRVQAAMLMPFIHHRDIKWDCGFILILNLKQCLMAHANLEPAREGLLGKGCFSLETWTQYKVTTPVLCGSKAVECIPHWPKIWSRGLPSCSPGSFHICSRISPSDVYSVFVVEPHGRQDSSEFFLLHLSSLQECEYSGNAGPCLDWMGWVYDLDKPSKLPGPVSPF